MARQKSPVISINPLFKLLIWVNSGLCLLTFIGMVAMAFIAPKDPTPAQVQLSTACETVFKMTAGAFIGLLGGRAAARTPRNKRRLLRRRDSRRAARHQPAGFGFTGGLTPRRSLPPRRSQEVSHGRRRQAGRAAVLPDDVPEGAVPILPSQPSRWGVGAVIGLILFFVLTSLYRQSGVPFGLTIWVAGGFFLGYLFHPPLLHLLHRRSRKEREARQGRARPTERRPTASASWSKPWSSSSCWC